MLYSNRDMILGNSFLNNFREAGIAWTILEIWKLGEKVEETHLPDFLDQKAKAFVLKKSLFLQEMSELEVIMESSVQIYLTNQPDLQSLESNLNLTNVTEK